jgi:hypothetical protein
MVCWGPGRRATVYGDWVFMIICIFSHRKVEGPLLELLIEGVRFHFPAWMVMLKYELETPI